jgi:hypothetical protein
MEENEKKDMNVYTFEKNENIDGNMVLVNVNEKLKNEFLKKINKNFSETGNYFKNANKIKNTVMMSLVSAAGIESYLGTVNTPLFIATTNVDNLMKIGFGFGSPIMESGRIAGHAPFIPISSGLVLPVLLTQIASSLLLLWQFGKIEQEIVKIGIGIQKLLKRDIANDIGYFSSSLDIINEIEDEFFYSQKFTTDMIERLGVVENNVKVEDEMYWTLIQDNILEYDEIFELTRKDLKDSEDKKKREEKLREKMKIFESKIKTSETLDIRLWVCFSILSVRILVLRNKLILQENPEYFEINMKKTKEEIKNYEKKWNKLIELCEMLERIKELEIIDKNIGNERRKLKEGLEKILVEVDKKEINKIIEEAKKLSLEKAENNNYSLVYWKDELGEHSYCVE